jgi:hypothetical protein
VRRAEQVSDIANASMETVGVYERYEDWRAILNEEEREAGS